jgi:Flp pilus assembly pilin Flp
MAEHAIVSVPLVPTAAHRHIFPQPAAVHRVQLYGKTDLVSDSPQQAYTLKYVTPCKPGWRPQLVCLPLTSTLERFMKKLLNRFVREDDGQDIIEYALLAAFISIVAWMILREIGQDVQTMYSNVQTATGGAAS